MKRNGNDRNGSGLLAVMATILIVTMGGAGLLYLAQQQTHAVKMAQHSMRAQIIAESGANAAYSAIKHNFAGRTAPHVAFDGGVYDVTVTTQADAKTAQIKCVGTYEKSQATVILDVKNFAEVVEGGIVPRTSPWAHGVFCNGYIEFKGASRLEGSVHVNNYLRTNGALEWGTEAEDCDVTCCGVDGYHGNGNVTIHGQVTAPDIVVKGQNHIREEEKTTPDQVVFPENLDLSAYYQIAQQNGQVYSSQNPKGPGGVRWINGDLTQNGTLRYTGCVIATGNIEFKGAVHQTQYEDYPAVVSRDGFLKVNGAHEFTGLIYARGNVTWNGAGDFVGSILCGGNMTFNGASGIIAYQYCEPAAIRGSESSYGSVTNDLVRITAWQR